MKTEARMYRISHYGAKFYTLKKSSSAWRRPVFKSPRAYANKSSEFGIISIPHFRQMDARRAYLPTADKPFFAF
jgi:hypothetical protein